MDNKKLKFSKVMFNGSFIFNPVLTQAIGICTVVAVGTSLKLSITFSVILSLLLIIMEVLASSVLKRLSRWLRIAVYMLLSTFLLLPAVLWMDKNLSELSAALGIYLPLLAVNSIIVIRCEVFAVNNSVRNSLFDATAACVGFSAVAVIVGFIREILAYGTVFGKTVSRLPALTGMALPFGGILVIGFAAAFHKWLIQKKFTRHPTNTFNLRTAFDKPVIHNEGINATDGTLSFRSETKLSDTAENEEPVFLDKQPAIFDDSDDDSEDSFGELTHTADKNETTAESDGRKEDEEK